MRAARVVVLAIAALSGATAACGALLGIGSDDEGALVPAPSGVDGAPPSDGDTTVVLDAGGPDAAADATKDALPSKIVFVSSATTLPAFDGGAEGANALCNELATNAGITGRDFVADLYLPGDVLGGAYAAAFLLSSDGWFLVSGARAFPPGSVSAGITPETDLDVDEHGTAIDVSSKVWTGTPDTLVFGGRTCEGWTSTSGNVLTGDPLVPNKWRDDGERPCNDKRHLYCFEK